MSLLEIEAEVRQMSPEQRAALQEILDAAEEGLSVEEHRKIESALNAAEASYRAGVHLTPTEVRKSLGLEGRVGN